MRKVFWKTELLDYMNPSFWSLNPTLLNSGQCLVQFFSHWPHLAHSTWQADFFAMVYNFSHWGDDSGGTAKTALCKIFYLFKEDFTFFHFQAQIFFCYVDQRTAGDRWQNRIRFRGYDFVIFVTNRKFAPPVSSTFVLVAESRYMFSSKPWR